MRDKAAIDPTWVTALPGAKNLRRALWAWRMRFSRQGRDGLVCLEHAGNLTLVILPNVFNGVLLRTGRFFAETLDEALIPCDKRVLDIGTGSGILALRAAQLGARVVAVDINPEAVRCARINSLLNHLEAQMEVRQGDLFAPVSGEQFDIVLCNPPFFRGQPRDVLDSAWRSENVFERLLAGLDRVLAPGGYALVVLSTDGDLAPTLASVPDHGWQTRPVASRDLINEILTVYRIERR